MVPRLEEDDARFHEIHLRARKDLKFMEDAPSAARLSSEFLTQAGVRHTHIPLASVGLHGNGHMEMLEMNNLEIAGFYEQWLLQNIYSGSRS
jgi:hypothetical protein